MARPTNGVSASPPISQTGSAGYQGSPAVSGSQTLAPVNAGQNGTPLSHPGH